MSALKNARQILFISIIFMLISNFSNAHNFLFVKWDASGSNNGTDWENAFTNLQDALNVALEDDTIFVARGIYYPDIGNGISKGDRSSSFALKNRVVIMGGYKGNELFQSSESSLPGEIWKKHWRDWQNNKTILSGDLLQNDNSNILPDEPTRSDNSIHVLLITSPVDSTTEINGLYIEGGNANSTENFSGALGGALYISSSSLQIKNCVFRNNTALESGGAIFSNSGELKLKFNSFINNYAANTGGAISFAGSDDLNAPQKPLVVSTYFYQNKTANKGAGIFAYNSSNVHITNSVFTENATINAGSVGSGVYCDSKSYPEIANCTFYKNNAISAGGGITLYAGRVSNSILRNNTASSQTQIHLEGQPSNPAAQRSFVTSDIEGGFTGLNIIDMDPHFVNAENPMGEDNYFGTPDDGLMIQNGSPVINKGTTWLNTQHSDILGYPRHSNDSIDFGAYEYQRFNVDYEQLYKQLKTGGYILLIRHAITDMSQVDSAGFQDDIANCTKQRNLSSEGIAQCDFLWHMMKLLDIPCDTVISSPMCRTKFTAGYIFGPYITTDIWMGVDSQYTDNKISYLGTLPPSGTNSVIVTHMNSIEEVTSFRKGEVQEGDFTIIKPLGGDNFEEIGQFTTDTWEKMIKYVPNNITGIDDEEINLYDFALYDNYPNPFNPSTTIEFQIPVSEHVSLKIYDILGREVASLVNEIKAAGVHKILFEASDLASGIYYYKLQAKNFNQTKKLVLMK